jgi:hypothetical protein
VTTRKYIKCNKQKKKKKERKKNKAIASLNEDMPAVWQHS